MTSKDEESAEQKEEIDTVRKKEEEHKALEDELKEKLKEEIGRSTKKAQQLKKAKGNSKFDDETSHEKRTAEEGLAEGDSSAKKVKAEDKEATKKTDSEKELFSPQMCQSNERNRENQHYFTALSLAPQPLLVWSPHQHTCSAMQDIQYPSLEHGQSPQLFLFL
jgi:NADH dehydrogenase/NADH:ubiquinone oxidoreductase subunit G